MDRKIIIVPAVIINYKREFVLILVVLDIISLRQTVYLVILAVKHVMVHILIIV